MKSITFILLVSGTTLIAISCFAKRPKHKPKDNTSQNVENQEEKETHHYQPNPIVIAGVGQIMNGALSIAQDPHNRPNIGHSIAHIIHGIMSIIVEKVAHKKIDVYNQQALQDCLDEVCSDMSKEITEIIITRFLSLKDAEIFDTSVAVLDSQNTKIVQNV